MEVHEGVLHVDIGRKASFYNMGMDRSARWDSRRGTQVDASFDEEGKGELIGKDAALKHQYVKKESVAGRTIKGVAADDEIAGESESGGEVMEEVGAGDMGMNLLQVFDVLTCLEEKKCRSLIEFSCRSRTEELGLGNWVDAAGKGCEHGTATLLLWTLESGPVNGTAAEFTIWITP